ncbi:signal transduction histidine kinase/tetratricopeptide (TPR) repeat protein [Flavobacterium gossypii]|uniref:histidine kinase n=1 Tax=Flavobacterium gossypii TaxID=1646119 RepID=A0ABR6DNX3_9FLAO|nr:tetratricopeptide repeat-containing sensor histidine kinase [Flavobacterium gossypii]MBA9073133.1 signal transduction histidine kinase/tetratricopeptide (TPR) repeat protein [Flavobacterium gossypii]
MKKNTYLFFMLGLLLFGCSKTKDNFSEKSVSDTLDSYLRLANEDTLPYESRFDYNKKAFAIIINQDNDSISRKNLFKVANRYFNMNNIEEYQKISKIIIEKSKQGNDTLSIAKAYSYLGDYFGFKSISDSAFLYYSKAEKLYNKIGSNPNIAKIQLNKAILQYNENEFLGSEISVFQAIKSLKGENNDELLYEANNLLGILYNELNEFDKSIEYHNKALEILKSNAVPAEYQSKATSLNNLGVVYQKLQNDKKAIVYFESALKEKNLFQEKPFIYAMLLDNIAYSKFRLNEFDELPGMFYKALKIRDSLDVTSGIIINKIHLSEYYAEKNDTVNSRKYAREALKLSKSSNRQRDVLSSLKQLSNVEPLKSSLYSKEYIRINDSLQQTERKVKDKFTRIEFETDEIIQQNDKLAEQNRNILFFFGLVVMIGVLLFVIKNQRSKTKELMLKQAQQKANEDIYNLMLFQQNRIEEGRANEKIRIAQELHDGILGRLFGARLNLDSLNKRQDAEAIVSRNNYLVELKNIEQDIREISHDLNREKHALNNNFIGIVNNLIEQQETVSQAKVSFVVDMEIEWEKIENYVKINLYRILQEALLNINKYSQAENVKIEIVKHEKTLRLIVSDDGVGFSVSKKSKGIGLQNMLSRANACEGTFDVKSKLGKGTIINVTFPMETNQKIT